MNLFNYYILKTSLLSFFGFLLFSFLVQVKQTSLLSPEQQKEDLTAWKDGFSKHHPGLYRWSSETDIKRAFEEAWASSETERSPHEFWHTLSRLNAQIRCGHAPLGLPPLVARSVMSPEAAVIPLTIYLTGTGFYVKSVVGNHEQVGPGYQIMSINGLKMIDIQKRVFAMTHADGFNTTVKRFDFEQKFAPLLKLYVFPEADIFNLKVKDQSGKISDISLPSATFQQWRGAVRAGAPPKPFEFFHLDSESIAVMRIRTLGDRALDRIGGSFTQVLDSVFTEIKGAEVESLILDIRGLSGGSDFYTIEVLSYLMAEPFRMFDRIEVTEAYTAAVEGGERAKWIHDKAGRKVIANHPGLSITPIKPNAFKGELHLITNGGTFSSGADLAAALHKSNRALIYGEETGGGYSGNTSGPGEMLKLPNSGIQVPVRQWGYITEGVDRRKYKGGVPPHIPILPHIKQLLESEDPVFDEVVKLVMGS